MYCGWHPGIAEEVQPLIQPNCTSPAASDSVEVVPPSKRSVELASEPTTLSTSRQTGLHRRMLAKYINI